MRNKNTKKLPYWLDQDFLINLLEQLPSHVFWKDKDGVYLGCNNTFASSFGLTTEDIIGKTDADLPVTKEDNESYRAKDIEVMTSLIPKLNIEEKQTLSDGREVCLLTSKVPLLDQNQKAFGVLGVYSDITELKKTTRDLEKAKKLAEAASQAKSDFISNMSHDLRTPITGILGVAQDLLNTAQESEVILKSNALTQLQDPTKLAQNLIHQVKTDSLTILNAIVPLINLCDEILKTVTLDKNLSSEPEVPESFDVYDLIEQNVALLQPTARHKKLDLSLFIDSRVPNHIYGLRTYLDRTLINLISNALKFTDKGFVKIKMTVVEDTPMKYKKDDSVIIQISIEDTGIGISEDKHESIFEHFSRLNASHKGIYKGYGLGLHTVKTYIQSMKGKIKVDSQEGSGTCFTITLPFIVSDKVDSPRDSSFFIHQKPIFESSIQVNSPEVKTLSISKNAMKVLVVEDHPIAARALIAAIRPYNCQIDTAETGKEAIRMAQNNNYKIIFMDVGLPDMSGIEVTKAIRALPNAIQSQVPIVAITGHADSAEIRKECIEAQMQDVLSKPARPLLLESVFNQFVIKGKDREPESQKVAALTQYISDLSLLDWEISRRMCEGNSEKFHEILAVLSEDLKMRSNLLHKAYLDKDLQAVHAELHRILGGVVYICSPRLETTLKTFQKLSDWNECDQFYHYLQQTIHAFRAECDEGIIKKTENPYAKGIYS